VSDIITIPPSEGLPALADQIRAEHDLAQNAFRSALEHARNCGLLLLRAKEQCAHGEWQPWLKAHVHFAERTAQAYMKIAREWERLEAKSATDCGFGIRDALEYLAEPQEPRRLEALPDQPPLDILEYLRLPDIESGCGYHCKARGKGDLYILPHPDDPDSFGMLKEIPLENEDDGWGKYWTSGIFISIKDRERFYRLLRHIMLAYAFLPAGEWEPINRGAAAYFTIGYFGINRSKQFMAETVERLRQVFGDVMDRSAEEWQEGFEHDMNANKEVAIWLAMADVFEHFTKGRQMGKDEKKDIFKVILSRSIGDKLEGGTPRTLTLSRVREIQEYMTTPRKTPA
jgi:hypothetical protein